MDRSDQGLASDSPISSHRTPWKQRHGRRWVAMKDLESVLRLRGNTYSLECSKPKEAQGHDHNRKEEGISQITEATACTHSNRLVPVLTTGHRSLSHKRDAASLSSDHVGSIQSSANVGFRAMLEHSKGIGRPCFPIKLDKEHDLHTMTSSGLGVDLNTVHLSNSVDHNPFYPFKKLGQVKSTDASECGNTTGTLEESKSLRIWKEMKQNGFLSSSHGGIPMPKQSGCHSRKKKDGEHKRRKRIQVNWFAKIAPPSELLSGLNPGIINHVRNSKQVCSILQATLQSDKLDGQIQNRFTYQSGRGVSEIRDRRKDQNCAHDSASCQFVLSLGRPLAPSSSHNETGESDIAEHRFHCETSTTSKFTSEYNDDMVTLKLSLDATMTPENINSVPKDDFPENQESITSLSLKAATTASQWLELLQRDTEGRLAALQRSKKKVKNVIQIELPFLSSTEFSPNQENHPCFAHSSSGGYSKKTTLEMHVARWESLFSEMDKTLYDEGKHLESLLRQLQEMQLHCEKGLKSVSADGLSQSCLSEDSRRLKKGEALESEHAIRAVAASIYSTSNFIMTAGDVPCY